MYKNVTILFIVLSATLQAQLQFTNLFDATKNDKIKCYRIPSLITAKNGDLIAAIDERVPNCGDLRYSKNVNIVLRRSIDNGKLWLPIETVVNFPEGQSASDPSMILDEITGKIFLFYNYMDLNNEKNIYYFHLVTSTNNGKTWSKPINITTQISKPSWKKDFKFITSGRGIQTSNGTLINTIVNLKHGLFIFSSKDNGQTWDLKKQPIGKLDESKIVQLTDGTLMINSRVNNNGARGVYKYNENINKWEEFKESQQLIDPSCNASIIRYTAKKDGFKKDRLLFVNPKSSKNRKNLTVRISYDEGVTWSEGKTIYKGSSAYSSMTILKNGDIGLFFEKDGYSKNVFTSFSLEWLTNGKDKLSKTKF